MKKNLRGCALLLAALCLSASEQLLAEEEDAGTDTTEIAGNAAEKVSHQTATTGRYIVRNNGTRIDKRTTDITIEDREYHEPEYHHIKCDTDPSGWLANQASARISVTIKYPLISGLKNTEIQDAINIQIQEAAGVFAEKGSRPTSVNSVYKMTYRKGKIIVT